MSHHKPLRIAIVAGETSGDLLGSGLIAELQKIYPSAHFYGIGGPRMEQSGCEILYSMDRIEFMGLDGLFNRLGDILRIRSSLFKALAKQPPDLFIGVDVPDFNISLEKKLRARNISTIHYVSPTLWAWRGYRIHKIRKAVSHMLVLFPFEKQYYSRQNIPVTCVGHPIADQIGEPNRMRARAQLNSRLTEDDLVVAVLPGSRGSEVNKLSTDFVATIRMVYANYPKAHFFIPFANSRVKEMFLKQVGAVSELPVTLMDGQARLAMEASNVVLLASGTAALEALLLERPHVVAYKLAPITWCFFRFLRHVDYYSMSNQLLKNPIVPELMQHDATPEKMFAALDQYLANPQITNSLSGEFRLIRQSLKLDASVQAAKAVSDMLERGND